MRRLLLCALLFAPIAGADPEREADMLTMPRALAQRMAERNAKMLYLIEQAQGEIERLQAEMETIKAKLGCA